MWPCPNGAEVCQKLGDGKPREAVRVLFSGPLNGDGSKSLAYDSDEISTDDETLPDASDDA